MLGTLTDWSPSPSDAKNDNQRNKFIQAIRADPKLDLILFLVVEWIFSCDQYDNQLELSLDLVVDQASKLSLLQLVKSEADLMSANSFHLK